MTDNTLHVPLSIVSCHYAELIRLNNEFQEPSYKIVPRKSINPLVFKGEEVSEKVLEHGDIIEIGRRGTLEYIVTLAYQAAEYGFV